MSTPASSSAPDTDAAGVHMAAFPDRHTANTRNSTAPSASDAMPTLFHRGASALMEWLIPAPLRDEYRQIIDLLAQCPYAYPILLVSIFVILVEWEQPGYFPSPDEWSTATVGFLCAGALVFSVFALLEYVETRMWPWDDPGWVWPWEALLWGHTVYNDDGVRECVSEEAPPASSGNNDPVIPSLPRGIGPLHPPSLSSMHRSGILGESPMPGRFRHFGGRSFLRPGKDVEEVGEEEEVEGTAGKKYA
ncbi:hypothetical protein BDW02DRAFT_576347 [Decorospora gaudefroyi]|uniref:Uncharacterized protein n=1 Tax=Decorospora gaudefroyi TaxID=184978 RepID=A0A6A5KMS0_9PLEO|nr:hypothetical protein BDW02DRAFT_576347 [Decorospora gaudefroyi]